MTFDQGCLQLSSDLRVSRRTNADPLIQELNVGDAAEPQGRGTGRLSRLLSFVCVCVCVIRGCRPRLVLVMVFSSQQVVL